MPQPERRDQRADLRRGEHLVEARALDVQDLALQRQDRLRAAVATLLRGAAGRIALDDKELRERRILFLAVCELAGQPRDVERALPPRQFARLARRFARAGRVDDLRHDRLRLRRGLEQELRQLLCDQRLHDALHFRGDELVFGLRGELRIRQLDGQHGRQALARVIAGGRHAILAVRELPLDVVVQGPRQAPAKTGQVRAAVVLRDVVRVAIHGLLVGIVPLERQFDADPVTFGAKPDTGLVYRCLAAIQEADELTDSAFVVERLALLIALVNQFDSYARVKKRELSQPFL